MNKQTELIAREWLHTSEWCRFTVNFVVKNAIRCHPHIEPKFAAAIVLRENIKEAAPQLNGIWAELLDQAIDRIDMVYIAEEAIKLIEIE